MCVCVYIYIFFFFVCNAAKLLLYTFYIIYSLRSTLLNIIISCIETYFNKSRKIMLIGLSFFLRFFFAFFRFAQLCTVLVKMFAGKFFSFLQMTRNLSQHIILSLSLTLSPFTNTHDNNIFPCLFVCLVLFAQFAETNYLLYCIDIYKMACLT